MIQQFQASRAKDRLDGFNQPITDLETGIQSIFIQVPVSPDVYKYNILVLQRIIENNRDQNKVNSYCLSRKFFLLTIQPWFLESTSFFLLSKTDYFRKLQNENGYFKKMTLCVKLYLSLYFLLSLNQKKFWGNIFFLKDFLLFESHLL